MSAEVAAIRIKQWLDEWEGYEFDETQHRRKPEQHAYLFALSAIQLRALSGVYRRKRDGEAADGVQRHHDQKRSGVIRDFVRYGYPYSSLPKPLRNDQNAPLKKPGWLPTAIVVNILRPEDERRGKQVRSQDLVTVEPRDGNLCRLRLPYADQTQRWVPEGLEPLEVIDGQHRLWAFDEAIAEGTLPPDFELPVVAFRGLDIGWQAYLFWSINVSPKRINPSHAFDLFPLLRSEGWLDTFSELRIYREARAQELVELLFVHPQSAWYNRINMLGDTASNAPKRAGVTQAGWVRALLATFLASGTGGRATKGLFGSPLSAAEGPLDWPRAQQAALLVYLWTALERAVTAGHRDWSDPLKEQAGEILEEGSLPAFNGPSTMLNQEQGVRGVLSVANDILFNLGRLDRSTFELPTNADVSAATTVEDVDVALDELKRSAVAAVLDSLAEGLATFDWRSVDAPGLSDQDRLIRRGFRGSGGYVALREQLAAHLAKGGNAMIAKAASALTERGD
jgi:hypothetical protein